MKITKRQLRSIIRKTIIKESMFSKMGAAMGFGDKKLDGMLKQLWDFLKTAEEMVQEIDGGKKISFDRLDQVLDGVVGSAGRYTKLAKDKGLTDAQEVQWKGFREKAQGVLHDLNVERTAAETREGEEEDIAEEGFEEMRRRISSAFKI